MKNVLQADDLWSDLTLRARCFSKSIHPSLTVNLTVKTANQER
jgi:hypothetical protein